MPSSAEHWVQVVTVAAVTGADAARIDTMAVEHATVASFEYDKTWFKLNNVNS
jgi:hypothetical protein